MTAKIIDLDSFRQITNARKFNGGLLAVAFLFVCGLFILGIK